MGSHSLSSQTIRAKFPIQSLPRAFNGPKPKSLFSLPSSPTQQSISFHIFPTMPLLTSASRRLQIHRRSFPSSKFRARALGSDSGRQLDVTRELIVLNSALTLILGVANRVLYKLALVPMKEYPFFLAQLTTFGYLAIYLSILYARYRAGIVTKEMVAYPKSRFFLIGFLEALGVLCGMYAGAMLPGPAIPILSQTFLVWQLTLSVFILGRSYSLNQIAGCLLVAAGVVLAVTSGSDSNQMLAGIAFVWPVLMVASSAFQAAASVIKGKVLDIFVVNSFGSGFQALFVLLFLPFLSNLKGIPFSELPSFLKSGAGCFFNIGNNVSGAISILLDLCLACIEGQCASFQHLCSGLVKFMIFYKLEAFFLQGDGMMNVIVHLAPFIGQVVMEHHCYPFFTYLQYCYPFFTYLQYCFQHISSQSYEDFVCCSFIPCCDVIRFSLPLSQTLWTQFLEVLITFEFYIVL